MSEMLYRVVCPRCDSKGRPTSHKSQARCEKDEHNRKSHNGDAYGAVQVLEATTDSVYNVFERSEPDVEQAIREVINKINQGDVGDEIDAENGAPLWDVLEKTLVDGPTDATTLSVLTALMKMQMAGEVYQPASNRYRDTSTVGGDY